ncbi:hypothetical protein Sango_2517900 [Sesamum angolense]|uniref:Protein TIFY n=1 Tax=Sesamum angolense TaxID=2727404 RepID=A0AAE1W4E5_9LAMI|nr:hypothetical protein Sango_2517900 [Sesamum angolense]
MMKREYCNLELGLNTPAPSSSLYSSDDERPIKQQQLTIFYNGRGVVSDATEFEARAILLLAKTSADSSSPLPLAPTPTPTPGVSMKRSLQRFLEKRKSRGS